MNNFMKKVIVTLTSVLMASSMVVSAAAASAAGTSCAGNTVPASVYSVMTNTNSSGCLTGIDVNSIIAGLNTLGCPAAEQSTSNGNVAGTTSTCPSSKSVQSATVSKATEAASCNGSTCTANAKCNVSTCTTSNCTTNAACSTSGDQCALLSGDGTSAFTAKSTVMDRINSALKKCGLGIKKFYTSLPGSTDTATTATPVPSAGTDTATPAPSAGTDTTATPPASTTGTPASGNIDNQSFEQQVVTLVNEQRAANGLAPLTLSAELSNMARAKSQDMHDNNYFSHTSPTYGSPFDMMKSFGITYRTAGENIAMGYATPEAVVTGWMNSAGHRANILNASYTQIGVGYVADGNYWTQEFIG